MNTDPDLTAHYSAYVASRICPCTGKNQDPKTVSPVVGFYHCRHRQSGRAVNLYCCARCLDLEATTWEHTRIADPQAPEPPPNQQLELMI